MSTTTNVTYLKAGSTQIIAQCEGIDSNACAVTVTGGTVNPSRPHEPSGYTRFAEVAFAGADGAPSLPSNGYATSGFGIRAGRWGTWNMGTSSIPAPTVVVDNSAPASPGACFRFVYPGSATSGVLCGNGPGMMIGWDTSGWVSYRAFYESTWFKIPSTNFELQPGQMKLLGYWGVGAAAQNGTEIYGVISGANFGSSFTLDMAQQGFVGRRLPANVTGATIRCSTWHQSELQMVLNDVDVGAHTTLDNGTLDVWLNDTLTHHYTDMRWRTWDNPLGFYMKKWDPIYGGSCPAGTHKTRYDYVLVDDIYLSGIRL